MARPSDLQVIPPKAQFVEEAAGAGVKLLKAVRKQWPIVVASMLLAGGAALMFAKTATPIYESAAMIEINPHAVQPLGEKTQSTLDLGADFYWDTREYYETQYKILRSDRVLGAVVRDLGLDNDEEFTGKVKPGVPPVEAAVAQLRSEVTVEPVKNSRLVLVKVDDDNAQRARKLCDAVANTYIDQNLKTAVTASADAVVWLSGQLDHVRQELEQNENALFDFKQRNELPSTSINDASNMLRVEMQEYDTALAHTRTRRQELEARKAELLKVDPEHPEDLPASEVLASVFLQQLRAQYMDALKQRDGLIASGKGENHPEVRAATEKVAQTKTALLAEVRNIEGAVERDLEIAKREEIGEAGLFDASRKRAVDLNMKEIEYHRLDRMRSENEKLYSLLLERMKDADLARMLNVNNVRVVDNATEPRSPVRPRVRLDSAIGLALGLLFGIALSWLRDQLDNSIKTPDDVEEWLGVTFLGLLPESDRASGGSPYGKGLRSKRRRRPAAAEGGKLPAELIVHEAPLSGVAEAARSVRTNLMFMNPDRPCRTLLVSSAAPAEGKTTVACSIAIAFAQGGQRVCIVDCDLRRPRLHRIFHEQGRAGLTNFLVGEATIEEVALSTSIENLSVVCAGPLPPNPADMLHSERFRTFLRELGERFDRVVIDSPPLVAVTDSAIISRLVDATLFVVRAFKTSRHLSAQGLRALRDVDAHVLGAVLNAVNLNRSEYSYYYHYQYYKPGAGYVAERAADESQPATPPN